MDIFIANAGVMPLTMLKNVRLEEWYVDSVRNTSARIEFLFALKCFG